MRTGAFHVAAPGVAHASLCHVCSLCFVTASNLPTGSNGPRITKLPIRPQSAERSVAQGPPSAMRFFVNCTIKGGRYEMVVGTGETRRRSRRAREASPARYACGTPQISARKNLQDLSSCPLTDAPPAVRNQFLSCCACLPCCRAKRRRPGPRWSPERRRQKRFHSRRRLCRKGAGWRYCPNQT